MNKIKSFKQYLTESASLDQITADLGIIGPATIESQPDWTAVRGYLLVNRDKIKSAIEKATGDRLISLATIKSADIYAESMRDGVSPNPDWLGTATIEDQDIPDLQDMVKTVIGASIRGVAGADQAKLAEYTKAGTGVKTSRY